MKRLLFLIAVFSLAAFAADISGNWKATAEGPNGTIERTFTFKVDGEKLTGETTSSFAGKSVIEDGKVSGDDVTFKIKVKFQDEERQVAYKGKVSGDTIKFTATITGADQSIDWLAKRN